MAALFPCASVTGAPKRRTMRILRENEVAPRGIYTGTIGWAAPGRRRLLQRGDPDRGRRPGAPLAGLRRRQRHRGRLDCRERVRRVPAEGAGPGRAGVRAARDDGVPARTTASASWRVTSSDSRTSAQHFALPLRRPGDRAGAARRWPWPGAAEPRAAAALPGRPGHDADGARCPRPPDRLLRVGLAARPVDRSSCWLHHKTTRREVYEQAQASRPDCDEVLLWNQRRRAHGVADRERGRRSWTAGGSRRPCPAGCSPESRARGSWRTASCEEGIVRVCGPARGNPRLAGERAARDARGRLRG